MGHAIKDLPGFPAPKGEIAAVEIHHFPWKCATCGKETNPNFGYTFSIGGVNVKSEFGAKLTTYDFSSGYCSYLCFEQSELYKTHMGNNDPIPTAQVAAAKFEASVRAAEDAKRARADAKLKKPILLGDESIARPGDKVKFGPHTSPKRDIGKVVTVWGSRNGKVIFTEESRGDAKFTIDARALVKV